MSLALSDHDLATFADALLLLWQGVIDGDFGSAEDHAISLIRHNQPPQVAALPYAVAVANGGWSASAVGISPNG